MELSAVLLGTREIGPTLVQRGDDVPSFANSGLWPQGAGCQSCVLGGSERQNSALILSDEPLMGSQI